MLTLACALFVGVSCTTDGTEDSAPALPVLSVDVAEDGLALTNEAGTAEFQYVVENAVDGVEPTVAVSEAAAWLAAEVVAADKKVVLTYEVNAEAESREAVVTLSYEGAAESVEVKVKQAGKESLTVTGAPEANLSAQGGEFTLNYVLKSLNMTAQLGVAVNEEAAAWLHVGEIGESTIPFTYDANTDAPGSEPREATITVSFEGLESVVVTVKQDSQSTAFSVEFTEISTNYAFANLTAADQNMDWLCLLATASDIVNGGFTTPEEYINAQYEAAKADGFPYLYMLSSIYRTGGGMGKGNSVDPIMCQLPWTAQPGDKLYMFVLGYNVDADLNNWAYDNSTLVTAPHIWEVPLLPSPIVTVQTENTVSSAAGSLVLDVTVENAAEGAEVFVSTRDAWVTPSYANGKLTLKYSANATALSRQASVTVEYGKKTFWGDGPDDWYIEPLCNPIEVVLVQEKNPNAKVVIFDIQVVETHFNRIVVNVTPSDKSVEYVLNTTPATQENWETGAWNPIEVDWLQIVNNTSLETTYKGDLVNHSILMSVGNYQWSGYDYYVYAFAVNADKTAPAGEASHTSPVKVDISDMPKLTLVEGNGLAWNAEEGYYELKTNGVEQEYVFSFNVENPVEGAAVTYNSSATGGVVDESWGTDVFGNDNQLVIDNEAKTIRFTVNPYPADWNKSYAPNRTITLFYTLGDEYWGIQAQIRVVLCPPAAL